LSDPVGKGGAARQAAHTLALLAVVAFAAPDLPAMGAKEQAEHIQFHSGTVGSGTTRTIWHAGGLFPIGGYPTLRLANRGLDFGWLGFAKEL
jgi:hypothetical protein